MKWLSELLFRFMFRKINSFLIETNPCAEGFKTFMIIERSNPTFWKDLHRLVGH